MLGRQLARRGGEAHAGQQHDQAREHDGFQAQRRQVQTDQRRQQRREQRADRLQRAAQTRTATADVGHEPYHDADSARRGKIDPGAVQ